jgi:hypothetical protein
MLMAASDLEARIALGMLKLYVPDRQLVTAINLREVLRELPRTPMPVAVDMEALGRIARMTKAKNAYERRFADRLGDFSLVVLGEGNMCYDIVVRAEDSTAYWSPDPSDDDFLSSKALQLMLSRDSLLDRMIELTQSMGLVFNPPIYHSLREWMMEHPGE